ncbi:hypothetical protein AK88_01250 [Plasmodium fragile]|uniref:Plasmodium RESA N-terminal domain-containing protein n=1 Tax=Plasmodium fragile TaxID=5857 RepID=A0A0D9QQ42_PLAFR|nr:uncharacterized protein AK88_01250 [Plasmodium fragile]KJP89164.1 hypothetical protein AK88_01250 [Plasmodium fragile]
MIGLGKWNATLLGGTLFGALMLNSLSYPQSAHRGRSLSELSLYLAGITDPENYHLGGHQPRAHDVDNDSKSENDDENDSKSENDLENDSNSESDLESEYESESDYEDDSNSEHDYESTDTSDHYAHRRPGHDQISPVQNNRPGNTSNTQQTQQINVYQNENHMIVRNEKNVPLHPENAYLVQKYSKDGNLPFECTKDDFVQILTNRQILRKVTYIALDISIRKAFIGYYYFIVYLNRCYYKMMNKLNNWFMNIASARNVPHPVQVVYWQKCRTYLLWDLRKIEEMSTKYFDALISQSPRVWTINYEVFLRRCKTLWRKTIMNTRERWSRVLSWWIVKYNQDMQYWQQQHQGQPWEQRAPFLGDQGQPWEQRAPFLGDQGQATMDSTDTLSCTTLGDDNNSDDHISL